uniref:Uncharacterized protein n=1 Tax=Arundo donax TaxID=35708 RepID=A0A0A9HKS3_ARUDO
MAPEVIVGSGHSLYVEKLFQCLVSCFLGFRPFFVVSIINLSGISFLVLAVCTDLRIKDV